MEHDVRMNEWLQYWNQRLSALVEKGVTREDLQDLYTDLQLDNLFESFDAVQVPALEIHVPLYRINDQDKVEPFSMEEAEEVLMTMEQKKEIDGYVVSGICQSVAYIE